MNREQLIGLILATTISIAPLKAGALENTNVDMLKSHIGLAPVMAGDNIKASSRSVFESIGKTGRDNTKCEQGLFYCSDFGGHAFIDQALKLEREKREAEEAERRRLEEEQRLERERQEKERQRISSARYYSYDLTKISNATYDEFREVLRSRTNGSMAHLAEAFIDAEKTYGVNAFFLAGLAALEGDWARSSRARNQNNLTGMAVYSDTSAGNSYASQYDCILDTARQISKFYLDVNGKYYGGGFGVDHVEVYYCASKDWSEKITSIAGDLSNVYGSLYR